MKKKNKGITLIALVITIIVLLILAGVSIATLGGENGIIGRARKAKTTTEEKQAEEEAVLLINEYEMYKKMCEAEGKEPNIEEFLEKNYKDKYKVEDGKYKIETESGENLEIDDKGNVKLNDEVIKANSVGSITISGLKEVEVGSNITLTVTINENNAIYKSIEWKCDDNNKATISPSGSNCIVTGTEEGRVVITCSIINYDQTQVSQEYEIEIKGKSVKSVTITGNTSVNVDSNITLTATISPSDAKYQSIEWSSNNTGIATVTENGTSCTVSGKTAGMATITCTIINNNGTNVSNTYNVTVIKPEKGTLKKVSLGRLSFTSGTKTFSAKSIPGYQNLTKDNFLSYCTDYHGSMKGDSDYYSHNGFWGTDVTNYDAKNGIVTVSVSTTAQQYAAVDEVNIECVCYYIEYTSEIHENNVLKKVSLGTTSGVSATRTYNAKNIPNYQKLTDINFVPVLTSFEANGWRYEYSHTALDGISISSYNASSGVVTVNLMLASQQNSKINDVQVNCICYYVE